MTPEQLSSLQVAANALPMLMWFTVIIGFLASLTVGLGMAMSLFYLHAMMSSLSKFNQNQDRALEGFEKLNESTKAQLLGQARLSEAWHRARKEQVEEEDQPGNSERTFPTYTQDWKTRNSA
mgnify:CR=1 FL=1